MFQKRHVGCPFAKIARVSELTPARVRESVGAAVTEVQARGLAEWYAALVRDLAAFPEADLREVEPPLRSMPGPTAP